MLGERAGRDVEARLNEGVMREQNQRYETVVVFDPSVAEADLAGQYEKIESIIKSHDGAVERKDVWGLRHLAYKINKKDQGYYVVFIHTGGNKLIADLRRQLRINDSVLRFLTVQKDKYAPDMIRPPADPHDSYRSEGYGGGFREGGFREGGFREGGFRDREGGGYRDGGYRDNSPRGGDSEPAGEDAAQ